MAAKFITHLDKNGLLLKYSAKELLYAFSPDDLFQLNQAFKEISCHASQAQASRRTIEKSIHWALENGTEHVQPYAILFQHKLATRENIDWMLSDRQICARCRAISTFKQKGLFSEVLFNALKNALVPERFRDIVVLLDERGYRLTPTIVDALSRMEEEAMGNLRNLLDTPRHHWQPDNNPNAMQNLELLLQGSEQLRAIASRFIVLDTAAVNLFFETYQNLPPADQTNQRYLGNIIAEMWHAQHPAPPPHRKQAFNPAQSTHTKSVHITVSTSALKLKSEYGALLEEQGLESVLNEIKEFVRNFCQNSKMSQQKCDAITHFVFGDAHRHGVLHLRNTATDNGSKVPLLELAGLIWLALADDSIRMAPLENAREALMNSFYESQRQYNLEETGKDDGDDKEKTSCPGGIFNNLVNHMQGILPQCTVRYTTENTVAFKARALVRETFLAHAAHRIKNMRETNDIPSCLEWIQKVQQDGIDEPLHSEIFKAVITSIEDEFFEDTHLHASFEPMVTLAMEYFQLEPDDIIALHTDIQRSDMHRMHERQLMQANLGLFGRMNRNMACESRQSCPAASPTIGQN